MPKLLLSNGTIQEECTSRETLFSNHAITAGTSNNSSRGSNYLGIPFVNEHCESEISSCLECWYRPYLQVSLSLSLSLSHIGNMMKDLCRELTRRKILVTKNFTT